MWGCCCNESFAAAAVCGCHGVLCLQLRAAADRHEAEMAVQRDEYQVEVDILQSRISELVREVEGLQGGKDEHTAEVRERGGTI